MTDKEKAARAGREYVYAEMLAEQDRLRAEVAKLHEQLHTQYRELQTKNAALANELIRAERLLRKYEWYEHEADLNLANRDAHKQCLSCLREKYEGHAPNCELDQWLQHVGEAKPAPRPRPRLKPWR